MTTTTMPEVSTPAEGIQQLVDRGLLVNLTPHPIRVAATWYMWLGDPLDAVLAPDSPYQQVRTNAQIAADQTPGAVMQWADIPAAGKPYRLEESDEPGDFTDLSLGIVFADFMPESPVGIVAGIVTRKMRVGELPKQKEDVTYIVSLPALMALAAAGVHRDDLIAPDTGGTAIRDESGQIKAVRGFVRLAL